LRSTYFSSPFFLGLLCHNVRLLVKSLFRALKAAEQKWNTKKARKALYHKGLRAGHGTGTEQKRRKQDL
ncbi:MAG: hypothetical protein IJP04_11705, partial [Clostridia bacterium]|nr:hypothetical protein [Clostridia bacterium]